MRRFGILRGTVSCQLDPAGDAAPSYSSAGAQQWGNASTDILGAVIAKGAKELAEAPGQAKVNRISRSVGPFERQQVIADMRREFAKAGYQVDGGATSKFVVNLHWYGIWKRENGLASPRISGNGRLYDSGGNLVWATGGSAWYNPKRDMQAYVANPQLYRTEFKQASQRFAAQLVHGQGTFSEAYLPKVAH